jgi:hypothetical protein
MRAEHCPVRPDTSSRERRNISMALLENILSWSNLTKALKRVEANKGAPGIDGVSTEHLRDYLREHGQPLNKNCWRGPTSQHLSEGLKSRNLTEVSGC